MKTLKNPIGKKIMKWIAAVGAAIFLIPQMVLAEPVVQQLMKLDGLLWSVLKIVGGLAFGFGVLQFGLSMKSHDPAQRTQGLLFVLGGLIIYLAKDILTFVAG